MGTITDDPRAFATDLAAALSDRGVRALLLRGPGPLDPPVFRPPTEPLRVELLVRGEDFTRARSALEGFDWNYQLGVRGPGDVHPLSVYSWARAPFQWRQAPAVELCPAIPAAPFPAAAFRKLERRLWEGASDHACGFVVPAADSLAAYLSLQAVRDGADREARLRHLADCAPLSTPERIDRTAAECGLRAALRWALGQTRSAPGGPGPGRGSAPPPGDRTTSRIAWRAGMALARRVRPRRLGARVSGKIGFGSSIVRCRFAGVEVRVGPGAFAPEVPSARLVRLALERLGPGRATVVEPGTGSGAISLAIAAGHPEVRVHAVERYRSALRWARRNRRRLRQDRVRLHHGSLLDPLPASLTGQVAVVVANLPYVPSGVWSAEGRFVDRSIRGGEDDGLGLYRRLARQALPFLRPGGVLVLEMGPYQVETFREEVTPLGYSIEGVEPPITGAVVVTARLGNRP